MKRVHKNIIIAVCVIIILFVIVMLVIGNYFYNIALNTKSGKNILSSNENQEFEDQDRTGSKQFEEWSKETVNNWEITSKDGLKLKGYFYPSLTKSSKYVIVVHGYTGEATEMLKYVNTYYMNGYNVLSVDLRGHGASEGDTIGMGWLDRKDMLLWIDKIIAQDEKAEIALFGISMGGATVMMTSGEDLPSNVKVIIEDCGYSSVKGIFSYQLDKMFNLPSFPIINFSSLITKIRGGYFFGSASTIKQLEKNKLPILMIHGDQDGFVPFYMLDENYKAASMPKEKYVVKGAKHGEAEKIAGDEYWNKVLGFMNKYIK